MSVSVPAAPPRILIVDDDERARQTAGDAFRDRGCDVLTVTGSDEAVRELRSSPTVHLVFTDVRLSNAEEDDDAGMRFGKYVKRIRPDVPVAVYSTHFTENELDHSLSTSAHAMFDLVVGRGGKAWDDDDTIQQCVELASRYRDERAAFAAANASADGPPAEFSVMRELVVREFAGRDESPPFTLRLLDISVGGLRGSIAVWVLEHDGHFSVELYQRPDLHAAARSLDAALDGLSRLLRAPLDNLDEELAIHPLDWEAIPLLILERADDEWDQLKQADSNDESR